LIEKVRNKIFSIAYKQQLPIFWIDSDVGFTNDDFFRIALSDKDFIGGAYRKKMDDEILFAVKVRESINENGQDDYDITPDKETGLLRVRGLTGGFCRMSLNCVNTLWNNEKSFYTEDDSITKRVFECVVNEFNQFVSEDISTSEKYTRLGGECWLDTRVNPSHVGTKTFVGPPIADWLANWRIMLNENNAKEANTINLLKPYFSAEEKVADPFYKIL
jgi:hypothetical protein